jgi:serine/threonine protein kinase
VSLPAGTRLGPYEVLGTLGVGGMGEVYRARDTRLDRHVALKLLPETFAADPDRLLRFEREAKTLASLNHPNIAQIHGVEGSGLTRAIVMELVEGQTLAELVARRPSGGPIEISEALDIACQIAEALEAAHEAGIVHRDLKPANIKVRPDGRVKVLDFGLAKEASHADGDFSASPTFTSPAMTAAGVILGTAAYMAPEQARGKVVDKRADIWAFGCVLYEALTGRSPFPGETVTDVIAAIVKNDPDWSALPSATPPRIRRLLVRCLQKDPRARLRDIGDARLEILDRDIVADTDRAAESRPRLARWIVLTALLALIAGAAGGALWPRTTARSAPSWRAALVGGPASLLQPVLSPDGQQFAFQTIVDGQTQIGVMKTDGGTWRVLTSDRTRGLSAILDWSPDGSRIFYDRQSDTLNGVFAVPSLGGDERLVLENAGFPVALQNGDLLVQRVNANRQSQLHRFSPSTGRLDPLPAIPDSSLSDDAVAASADGRYAYYFGQPLDDPNSPPAFYKLDVQTGRSETVSLELNLKPPVSLAVDRETDDLYVGGVDGDAFQILRIPAASGAPPQSLLTLPDAARIEVDRRGGLFVAVRARPAELFTFPTRVSADRAPVRLETLPMVNARKSQTLVPLPDGRFLVSSRSGERDRMLVVQAGKRPYNLVDGDEETRAPATAVGTEHAAVMMGPPSSPDIAVVNTNDGRLVRRFKAPTPSILTLGASPDGRTLYYAAGGSIWTLPATGGTSAKLGDGDSFTVDQDTGDLVVKLDEGARMRLVMLKAGGGPPHEIAVRSELRLIPRPLVPGAIRQGRLLLGAASADSWFWHAAMLDLKTGTLTKLAEPNPSDFHFVTWRADGVPIALGYGIDTALWHYTSRPK